ncbi:UNKNOWN [Stylonychia lemnae]|uniref:Uncharacterized protein n=1 Tax=Stylonychia lemnae TaxID=5949 RepID=A0A078A5D8_STYLE|nr:UNKNOWN [Stylonychia lemnae]|eukprot:CDW77445.1 UNKNOWN [Stylonychia lemnae]
MQNQGYMPQQQQQQFQQFAQQNQIYQNQYNPFAAQQNPYQQPLNQPLMNYQQQMPMHSDPNLLLSQNTPRVVTQTTDSLNDRNAFEDYLTRFEQEYDSYLFNFYRYVMKNAQRDRTPSPMRRVNSENTINRSRSASPLYSNEFQNPAYQQQQQQQQPQFNLSNQNQANLQNFMPTATEKQRLMYMDPHRNSNGPLMNERRNDPLNFRDMKQQVEVLGASMTYRDSPAKTAGTFYDQIDPRTSRTHFSGQSNGQYQIPTYSRNQNMANHHSVPEVTDTIGTMKKSLQQYEIANINQDPYVTYQINRERSKSPIQQNNLGHRFDQSISIEQAQNIHNNSMPSVSIYKRDEQRIKMMQIMNQPQLKTTLTSSQYMRELREQSLRQIQNWEHVQKDYEEKIRKQQEELKALQLAKPGTATNQYGRSTLTTTQSRYGGGGGSGLQPTMSANSFMKGY